MRRYPDTKRQGYGEKTDEVEGANGGNECGKNVNGREVSAGGTLAFAWITNDTFVSNSSVYLYIYTSMNM